MELKRDYRWMKQFSYNFDIQEDGEKKEKREILDILNDTNFWHQCQLCQSFDNEDGKGI